MQITPGRIEHIELPDGTTIVIDCSEPDEWQVSHMDVDHDYTASFTVEPAI